MHRPLAKPNPRPSRDIIERDAPKSIDLPGRGKRRRRIATARMRFPPPTILGVDPPHPTAHLHVVVHADIIAHRTQLTDRRWPPCPVAETLVPSFRRTKPGGRRIPLSRVGYSPEHVPAFLPQEWADRHLSVFTGISTRLLRRTAATCLVRRAQGRGLNEAAQFLGISTSDKSIGFGTVLSRWSRAQDNLHAFDMAVDAIAADLESSPRIDYQRRRQALATWTLPPAAWTHMVDRLDVQPGNRASTDARKRLAVSACIWARVTQGEHHRSPCPPDILSDPGTLKRWRRQRAETAHWLSQADEHPFYRDLKSLLDGYADQLADATSRNGPLP